MKEALTELGRICAAWVRGQGPLYSLLAAWWAIYVNHNPDPSTPIPYRVIE